MVLVFSRRTGTLILTTPARTAAAHALIATAVSHHDRAADVATGRVSEVNQFSESVGSMDFASG